jgi:hypothetical protein
VPQPAHGVAMLSISPPAHFAPFDAKDGSWTDEVEDR